MRKVSFKVFVSALSYDNFIAFKSHLGFTRSERQLCIPLCLSVNALYALRPRSHVALRGQLCEGVCGVVFLSGNGVCTQ